MIAEGSGTRLICNLQEAGVLSFLQPADIQQNIQLFASPFAENNSIQNHRLHSRGRAWFYTEIISTVERGKDRKEAGKKGYAENQCSCSSRKHHHVCDLSVRSTYHGHISSLNS